MLTDREILSTLEMLQSEHLDVRTVTLGINLLDCTSHDLSRLKDNIFKKISTLAGNLVPICERVGEKYGIPVVNKRISVSPIAVVAGPFSSSQMIDIARTLNQAAADVGVDFIGGFTALVEKGISKSDRALIDAVGEKEISASHSVEFLLSRIYSRLRQHIRLSGTVGTAGEHGIMAVGDLRMYGSAAAVQFIRFFHRRGDIANLRVPDTAGDFKDTVVILIHEAFVGGA